MLLKYEEGKEQKLLQVVRVKFGNKRAKIPKQKKKKIKKNRFNSGFTEDGFEREFGDGSGNITMTDGYREEIKNNLSSILMQASATPVVKDGEIIGFAIEEIDDKSIFQKAGFNDGDIVTSINGKSLTDAATAIKILNSLKETDNMSFDFLRGGESYSVNVDVQ